MCGGHYLERVKGRYGKQLTFSATVAVMAVGSVAQTVLVERTEKTTEKSRRVKHVELQLTASSKLLARRATHCTFAEL